MEGTVGIEAFAGRTIGGDGVEASDGSDGEVMYRELRALERLPSIV